MWCAICTADIPRGTERRDGPFVICVSCATVELDTREPEVQQRGYGGGEGGIGAGFSRKVAAAHDAIVPEAIVKLDSAVAFTPANDAQFYEFNEGTRDQAAYRRGPDSRNRSMKRGRPKKAVR